MRERNALIIWNIIEHVGGVYNAVVKALTWPQICVIHVLQKRLEWHAHIQQGCDMGASGRPQSPQIRVRFIQRRTSSGFLRHTLPRRPAKLGEARGWRWTNLLTPTVAPHACDKPHTQTNKQRTPSDHLSKRRGLGRRRRSRGGGGDTPAPLRRARLCLEEGMCSAVEGKATAGAARRLWHVDAHGKEASHGGRAPVQRDGDGLERPQRGSRRLAAHVARAPSRCRPGDLSNKLSSHVCPSRCSGLA